jgi:hypothetical protein
VVLRDGVADEAASAIRRQELRSVPKMFRLVPSDRDEFAEMQRICRLAPADARVVGVSDGALVEYVSRDGAPLRAWALVSNEVTEGCTPLGPIGRLALGLAAGDRVEIRALCR